jgi:hypothetical protein
LGHDLVPNLPFLRGGVLRLLAAAEGAHDSQGFGDSLRDRVLTLGFSILVAPHFGSDTEEIVEQELHEQGLFEIGFGFRLVDNGVTQRILVLRGDPDCFLEDFVRNRNLNNILQNL